MHSSKFFLMLMLLLASTIAHCNDISFVKSTVLTKEFVPEKGNYISALHLVQGTGGNSLQDLDEEGECFTPDQNYYISIFDVRLFRQSLLFIFIAVCNTFINIFGAIMTSSISTHSIMLVVIVS